MKSTVRLALCKAGSVIAEAEEQDPRPANLSGTRQLVADAADTVAKLAVFEGRSNRPSTLNARILRDAAGLGRAEDLDTPGLDSEMRCTLRGRSIRAATPWRMRGGNHAVRL